MDTEKQINLNEYISFGNTAMTRDGILRKIDEVTMACDKVPIAKLLTFILRKKGELHNDPYNWSDKTFLKKLEQYQREFSKSYNPQTGEFDLNEEYATGE